MWGHKIFMTACSFRPFIFNFHLQSQQTGQLCTLASLVKSGSSAVLSDLGNPTTQLHWLIGSPSQSWHDAGRQAASSCTIRSCHSATRWRRGYHEGRRCHNVILKRAAPKQQDSINITAQLLPPTTTRNHHHWIDSRVYFSTSYNTYHWCSFSSSFAFLLQLAVSVAGVFFVFGIRAVNDFVDPRDDVVCQADPYRQRELERETKLL